MERPAATALDYGKQRIRVNAVCPGTIRTAMYERRIGTNPAIDARLAAEPPVGPAGHARGCGRGCDLAVC